MSVGARAPFLEDVEGRDDAVPDVDGGPAASLDDLLRAAAAEVPDRTALVESGGRRLSWAALDDEVGRVATGLDEAGVVAGYRVALVLGNRLEQVACYLGVLRAGAVAVPLGPGTASADLARVLAGTGARVVVADESSAEAVREAVTSLDAAPRVVLVGCAPRPGERAYADLLADRATTPPALVDPERLAALLHTGGTTGPPRLVMLSHRALAANVEQVAAVSPPLVHPDDVVLGLPPLTHVFGLGAVLGAVLRQRARLVLVDGEDPAAVLDLVEDEACSVVPLTPPVLAAWLTDEHLAERLGPVRLVLAGAGPVPREVVVDLAARTGVPVHQGYGLTEAAPVLTSTLGSDDPDHAARHGAGAPLPGVEVRLVDAAGRPVGQDDPGEVEVRGANLFSGYWPDGAGGPGPDGWWRTGDLGMLDAAGDLRLVDRVDDVVVVSGFPVYPAEVEEVVGEVEGVAAVAVVGAPDAGTGQAVVAHVVPAAGTDAPALRAAVEERCTDRLARFKRPARVAVVARLPRTATGRVHKGRLRADVAGDGPAR